MLRSFRHKKATHTHTCTHACAHTHICTHERTHMHTQHTCTCTRNTHMHTPACTHTQTPTHVHTHVHTHTCTHTQAPDCTYKSCSVHEMTWKQRHPVATSTPGVKILVSKHHSQQREPGLLGEAADSRAGARETRGPGAPWSHPESEEALRKMGACQTQMPA